MYCSYYRVLSGQGEPGKVRENLENKIKAKKEIIASLLTAFKIFPGNKTKFLD